MALTTLSNEIPSITSLINAASSALLNAQNAAEVLEARDMASFAYDVAKRAARLQKAKHAHDELIDAVHRTQANALEIEAQAKRRLADEYDAAQARGEAAGHGGARNFKVGASDLENPVTISDFGLTKQDISEARQIRDAEKAEPGIVRRALDEQLEHGDEPTKAALRKVVLDAALRGLRGGARKKKAVNPLYKPNPAFDAMANVAGSCSDITEIFEKHGADFILSGCVTPFMRENSIERITRGRDVLNLILQAANVDASQ